MKVNILLDDPEGVRAGYMNVDPFVADQEQTPERVRLDPADLSPLVDAGEAEELRAMGVLDYLPLSAANPVLDHWTTRLAHGGKISLSCVDLLEVTRALTCRIITPEEANVYLHGEQKKPWQARQASYTLSQLADAMTARGLKVLSRRVSGLHAIVVAERP